MKFDVGRETAVYNGLSEVFKSGAYSTIVFNRMVGDFPQEADRAYIAKLFYGTLEKSVQFDYIIERQTDKRPKNSARILLKIGLYMQRYMRIPDYAVNDRMVELCRALGKGGLAGFVNAVLRSSQNVTLPEKGAMGDTDRLSVVMSCPKFIVEKLCGEYGIDTTERILSSTEFDLTHVRRNASKIDKAQFESILKLSSGNSDVKISEFGYYVRHNDLKMLPPSFYTVQSFSSMLATNCYAIGLNEQSKVLDLCAAPGGKSVYLKQLTNADVIACDLYPHRVELIKKYAERMGVKLKTRVNDATVFNEDWVGKFDCVVCDVPCSGLGELASKPDIMLWRDADSLKRLTAVQRKILSIAGSYVKSGGRLFYSTCTLLKEENEENAEYFLSEFGDSFEKISIESDYTDSNEFIKVLPSDGRDGFFVAAFGRKS